MEKEVENIEPATVTPSSKSNNKIIFIIIGLVVVCGLLICCIAAGMIFYTAGNESNSDSDDTEEATRDSGSESDEAKEPSRDSESTTEDSREIPNNYLTYKDSNFEISYPGDWEFIQEDEPIFYLNIANPVSSDTVEHTAEISVFVNSSEELKRQMNETEMEGVFDVDALYDAYDSLDCEEASRIVNANTTATESYESLGIEKPIFSVKNLNGLKVCSYTLVVPAQTFISDSEITSTQYSFVDNGLIYSITFTLYGEDNSNEEELEEILSTFNLI